MDEPYGAAKLKFIRSLPLEKALTSTLLAYEMNGEPLPLEHGYPLRVLALGWTGANCAKWLKRIRLLDRPYEGHYMDKVYRIFQKGEEPGSGNAVTQISLKSIITQPLPGETLKREQRFIRGASYGGERSVAKIEISADGGRTWAPGEFIGPHEPFSWRQWQYLWNPAKEGAYCLLAGATDAEGSGQPLEARWNVFGYGNNGVREHGISVYIT